MGAEAASCRLFDIDDDPIKYAAPSQAVDPSLSRIARIYVCLVATETDGRGCCQPVPPEEDASPDEGGTAASFLMQDAPLVTKRRLQRGLAVLRDKRDAKKG